MKIRGEWGNENKYNLNSLAPWLPVRAEWIGPFLNQPENHATRTDYDEILYHLSTSFMLVILYFNDLWLHIQDFD